MPLAVDEGVVLIGIHDCSGDPVAEVRFAALPEVQRTVADSHFSIHPESPLPTVDPTGDNGVGGLGRQPPGVTTIDAYVGDGCFVAEARVLVENDRLAYVVLVPNGFAKPR